MATDTTYVSSASRIPAVAFLLADHLDRALAAVEDLEAAGARWPNAAVNEEADESASDALRRQVVAEVRAQETRLIGAVLRARRAAEELAGIATLFGGMTRLFIGGTAALVDAVAELGDPGPLAFETGDCMLAYLRRRGVLDAQAPAAGAQVAFGADFLVAGRIPLGPLAEMIVAYLDALESQYDLYPQDHEDASNEAELASIVPPTEADLGVVLARMRAQQAGRADSTAAGFGEAADDPGVHEFDDRGAASGGQRPPGANEAAVRERRSVLRDADEVPRCSLIARLDAVAAFSAERQSDEAAAGTANDAPKVPASSP